MFAVCKHSGPMLSVGSKRHGFRYKDAFIMAAAKREVLNTVGNQTNWIFLDIEVSEGRWAFQNMRPQPESARLIEII